MKKLFDRFFSVLRNHVQEFRPTSLLDAGCGEGETLERLGDLLPPEVTGFDLNPECVAFTSRRHPAGKFTVQDITRLPFKDGEFDVAMSLEVLEHLPDPGKAIDELRRVTRRALLLSVPYEPWFRLGNLFRGKYLAHLGNHPEHINHWNPASFHRLLAAHGVNNATIEVAFPWIIARCDLESP